MKMRRGFLFLLSALLFLICANAVSVSAMETGFEVGELSEEEKNTVLTNVALSSIKQEPAKQPIACFDVSDTGLIAVGQESSSSKKTICVYSADGVFQYGYTFSCTGSFGVEWDRENLNIYLVRGDVLLSVTSNGDVVGITEVQDTIENTSYINRHIHATQKTVGDTTYCIRTDIGLLNVFAPAHSQIVVTDSAGAEQIIYDVNSSLQKEMLLTIGVVCVFVAVACVVIFISFKKKRDSKISPHI